MANKSKQEQVDDVITTANAAHGADFEEVGKDA